MRIAHFLIPNTEMSALGAVTGDHVVDIRVAWAIGNLEIALTNSLTETICQNLTSGALQEFGRQIAQIDPAEIGEGSYPLADVQLLAPVQPRSFRDFYAFEAHVRNARLRRGLSMLAEWYEQPVFYFSNTASIAGPGAAIRRPPDSRMLDYELEMAAVIGREGSDIPAEEADDYIAGFTILNDWSARDLQMREMKVGLGPAKGKDFATSIGPWLVTPDELTDRKVPNPTQADATNHQSPAIDRGMRYDLEMTALVNGREYSRGNARDMHWTFAQLIAQASRNTSVRPGDLIGSGTVGGGCILEFPEGDRPWLQPGDEVRLRIDHLGELVNTVED